jgi:hypothetical protein
VPLNTDIQVYPDRPKTTTPFGQNGSEILIDRSSHGSQGQRGGVDSSEMQSMKQDMQKKMSAAKTDEERQALMAAQQKLMQGKQGQMMSMHSEGHVMPSYMAVHQQMMQKHMGSMNGQMPMGSMSH